MPDELTIADILRSARRQQTRAQTQQRRLQGRDFADIVAENQIRRTGRADVDAAQRYAGAVGPRAQAREAGLASTQLGDPAQIEAFQQMIGAAGGGVSNLFRVMASDALPMVPQPDVDDERTEIERALGQSVDLLGRGVRGAAGGINEGVNAIARGLGSNSGSRDEFRATIQSIFGAGR